MAYIKCSSNKNKNTVIFDTLWKNGAPKVSIGRNYINLYVDDGKYESLLIVSEYDANNVTEEILNSMGKTTTNLNKCFFTYNILNIEELKNMVVSARHKTICCSFDFGVKRDIDIATNITEEGKLHFNIAVFEGKRNNTITANQFMIPVKIYGVKNLNLL